MIHSGLPVPTHMVPDEERPYWSGLLDGELRVQRCAACAGVVHPPRVACPRCGDRELAWTALAGTGAIVSLTRNHRGAGAYADAGVYVIAYVQLDDGPLVVSNIVGPGADTADVGTRVRAVFDGDDAHRALRFEVAG